MKIIVKGGRVIDPGAGKDEALDLIIENGILKDLAPNAPVEGADRVIDAGGLVVTPGLIDIHVHLRDPGYEYMETIISGAEAALAGGVVQVACMANTRPVHDNAQVTRYILEESAKTPIEVHPICAATVGLAGEKLAPIGEMATLGAVAVSDDGQCIMNSEVQRRVMEYAKGYGVPVITHPEDMGLAAHGHMNEGAYSLRLGVTGKPRSAEDIMIARDILLAEYTGARLHLAHLSTRGGVEMVRAAKARGVPVTAEVTPHHFTLTDEAVGRYDTHAKMSPPLRTEDDIEALLEGLKDGTIDCIASDHAPQDEVEKDVEFDEATNGIIGLETLLPLSLGLCHRGVLTLPQVIASLSCEPARVLSLPGGTLQTGERARVTIIDPNREFTVQAEDFKSKTRNSPFIGWKLKGRAVGVIAGDEYRELG